MTCRESAPLSVPLGYLLEECRSTAHHPGHKRERPANIERERERGRGKKLHTPALESYLRLIGRSFRQRLNLGEKFYYRPPVVRLCLS